MTEAKKDLHGLSTESELAKLSYRKIGDTLGSYRWFKFITPNKLHLQEKGEGQ